MIGLVLVTHGRLAEEFVTAMEHVVGKQERIATIAIGPDDDMEARRADIAKAIAAVDTGRGVIVLTDLCAPKPKNCNAQRMWMTTKYYAANPYFATNERIIAIDEK